MVIHHKQWLMGKVGNLYGFNGGSNLDMCRVDYYVQGAHSTPVTLDIDRLEHMYI